jgi:hypothetical protein
MVDLGLLRVRRLVYAVVDRVRHRGAILLALAAIDLIYGAGMIRADAETRGLATYRYIGSVLPLPVWGGLWIAVGAVCLVSALRREDRVAYALAVGLKVFWGLVFLLGWLLGEVPRGYVSTAIWLVFACIVLVVSTWPEPAERVPDGGE